MLTYLIALLLLLGALLFVVLRKTYNIVPAHELKRQAAAGNDVAKQLWQAVAYGDALRVLLWMCFAITAAGAVALLSTQSVWLAFIVLIVLLWLAFSWLPNTRVSSTALKITLLSTTAVARLLHLLDRPLKYVARLTKKRYAAQHSGLYELNDLMNLLDLQSTQADSRITTEEIDLIRHVLQFGDHKVRDVLRPRNSVKSIAITDAVGPVLLDELHASGQSSFPVKKSARSKEIVGTLHIGDVGIHSTGTVQDYVTPGVTYIHEADSLADALHAFYQTRRQLFIVVDSFEANVGILTLEDILFELVDRPELNNQLGSHDDITVVAARHNHKPTPEAESELSETDQTVVE